MYCIKCGNDGTKVIDSRTSEDRKSIRRRRECENCHNRFTTFEKIEGLNLIVLKSGDRMERYNKDKLEDSILKSINKRNISIHIIEDMIRQLEYRWINKKEILSKDIGKDVLDALIALDEVAYIRYASIYLNFNSSKDFIDLINKNKRI